MNDFFSAITSWTFWVLAIATTLAIAFAMDHYWVKAIGSLLVGGFIAFIPHLVIANRQTAP